MQAIINVLFMFFGKYIKGYRTLILSIGMVILGAWEWITGSGLFDFLCSISPTVKALAVFCNVTEAKFYGIILFVVGVINAIIRKLTDTPIAESGTSAFSVRRVGIGWVIIASVFFLVMVFIILPLLIASASGGLN